MRDAIDQFRAAIQSAGLIPPDMIEPDGKLHRFASNGARGDDAGWYALHGDGIPAGSFGDWRSGQSQTWRADIGRTPTPGEEAAHRAKVGAEQLAALAAAVRKHATGALAPFFQTPRSGVIARRPSIYGRSMSRPEWRATMALRAKRKSLDVRPFPSFLLRICGSFVQIV